MSDPALFGLCRESGPRVDEVLVGITALLRDRGARVEGFVQERLVAPDCGCPGIVLHDLATGTAHDISERRGPGARGCNLDWGALTQRAGELEARIAARPPALVIVSRFGKAEAEGRGFCAAIEAGVERAVPVLVAYRAGFAAAWAAYHGGMARDLAGGDAAAITAEARLLQDHRSHAR